MELVPAVVIRGNQRSSGRNQGVLSCKQQLGWRGAISAVHLWSMAVHSSGSVAISGNQ
jgi:hypothetical protein